jgi:hypothetical protein
MIEAMEAMEADFVPLAKNFLSRNSVSISDTMKPEDFIQLLAKHFEALVFNITSLAAMVTVIFMEIRRLCQSILLLLRPILLSSV